MAKVRVYELAEELGVESKTIMSIARDLGEFVRSASSTLEPTLIIRIRHRFFNPTGAPTVQSNPMNQASSRATGASALTVRRRGPLPPHLRVVDPSLPKDSFEVPARRSDHAHPPEPLRVSRTSRPRPDGLFAVDPPRPYEWYRGGPLGALAQHLLDQYVIRSRNDKDRRNLRPGKHFVREVRRANELAEEWSWALMHGWNYDEITDWAPTGLIVSQAVVLKSAGVVPSELGWHYEDQGRGDLKWRLTTGS